MVLIDEATHKLWLKNAKAGNPPNAADVMKLQYGLDPYWYLRKYYLPLVKGLGWRKDKRLAVREASRGSGKSAAVNFIVLYAAEYIIPFIPNIRPENMNILLVGRDVKHITHQNLENIEKTIAYYAPWLKLTDSRKWKNADAVLDAQIRQRTWNKDQFNLTNGINIKAFGFNQTVRGEHVYLLIIDDLLEEKNALFGTKQMSIIQAAMRKAVQPGGSILVVGTPQCEGDIYMLLQAETDWSHVALPVMEDEVSLDYVKNNKRDIEMGYLPADTPGKDLASLCPALWPMDAILQERGSTRSSEIKFQQELMLKRLVDASLLVNPDDFAASKDPTLCYAHSIKGGQTYGGGDPSSLKVDNAGLVVGTVDEDGNRIPLYIERIDRGTGDALLFIDRVAKLDGRMGRPNWLFEKNGYQSVIKPLLEREHPEMRNRIDTLMLSTNKHADDGFPIIKTMFESRRIRMPYGPTPQEQRQIEAGLLNPIDIEAIRITDMMWHELQGVRVIDGKIVEDNKRPNDLVAALFFFLRATAEVKSGVGVSVVNTSGVGEKKKVEKPRPSRYAPKPTITTPQARLQRVYKYLSKQRGR